jgi:hypothetical protein
MFARTKKLATDPTGGQPLCSLIARGGRRPLIGPSIVKGFKHILIKTATRTPSEA